MNHSRINANRGPRVGSQRKRVTTTPGNVIASATTRPDSRLEMTGSAPMRRPLLVEWPERETRVQHRDRDHHGRSERREFSPVATDGNSRAARGA